jgi:predicted enzyme related to lactoylglutathione lyase
MANPNFFILCVDNPISSANFYADLLGQTAIDASPTFAMFKLKSGVMLGLWSKHTVEPDAVNTGGGGEVVFAVESKEAVLNAHEDWSGKGLPILQTPLEMDFGFTFVALDPDQHRLRVFVPNAS